MTLSRRHLLGAGLAGLPLPALAQTRRTTDALGREVALPAEARRIVTMFN